jgi:CYTH domain-containing protein
VTEVERKFLVIDAPPDLTSFPGSEIRQGYLAVDPDATEVRVRSRDHAFVLTVKQGRGRSRAEVELDLDQETFDRLWPLTKGRRVEKRRYVMPAGEGIVMEVDVYSGALAGLVVAEVEFPDDDRADAFDPPSWFGPEVTHDPRFKNQSLARDGMPTPS